MNPRIVAAQERLRKAEANLQDVVARVQADCKHKRVAELSRSYGGSPPHRICEDCGYEEISWSWWKGIYVRVLGGGDKEVPTKLAIDRVRHLNNLDELCELRPR